MMSGVYQVALRVQGLIDHHACSQGGGSGSGGGKRFEPMGRIAHCPGYRQGEYIRIESGARVVPVGDNPVAIDEEG